MNRSGAIPVVLDTQVWLDLLHFADPGCDVVRDALAQGRLQAVTDAACREEWIRVLGYASLGLDPAARGRLQNAYDDCAVMLACFPTAGTLPRCADSDDQKFVALAVNAGAACLFTRDAALLALAARMRRHYGIAVLAPATWDERASSRSRGEPRDLGSLAPR